MSGFFSSFRTLDRYVIILWLAGIISDIGSAVSFVGVMALANELTGLPSDVGIVMATQALPVLVLGFFGGILADSFHRKYLMIWADFYCMIISFLFLLASSIPLVSLLAALLVMGTIVFKPSRDASIPDLVSNDNLTSANSLFGINRGLSFFIGSAIAGMLIKVISVEACFIFNGISFLLSALLLMLIPGSKFSSYSLNIKQSFKGNLYTTKNLILNNSTLAATIFILACFMVEVSIVNPLLPLFTSSFLNRPAEDFGFILSCIGMGGIIGAPLIPFFAKKIKLNHLMVFASAIHGFLMFSLVLSRNFYLVLVLVAIIGVFGVGVNVCGQILLQVEGKGEHLGKVFAFSGTISSMATIVGLMIGGYIGSIMQVEQAWIVSGAFGVAYPVAGVFIMKGGLKNRKKKELI